LKKANGVQLVGEKKEVAKWKVVLEECLREAGTVPFAVKLSFEQGRLFTQERLDSVKASSEAQKVLKSSRNRETVIEITGSDEQKEKAKTAIQEINDKLSFTATIEDVSESSKRYLTGKGITRLREVEKKHDVFVSVDRKSEAGIKIVGEADNVAAAKELLEQVISSSASITKEINIEWDEGRVVIGKSGATVNHIRRESGLDSLKVEEDEEKKKVVLRASQEACDAAEQMIKEALQKDKERAAERAAKAEKAAAEGTVAEKPKPAAKEVKKASPAKAEEVAPETDKRPSEKKWGGKNSAKVDFDPSKANFPGLGGDTGGKGGKKGKRRPNNSAWKSVEGEEDAEDNAGEEEAAADDAAGDDAGASKEVENVQDEDGGN